MSGLDDDDLRSMLAARGDRVSPGVSGDVMRAVRAELRGPRRGIAFAVLPLMSGRTPAIGTGWAAAAVIAVLLTVMLATRPPVAAPVPSAPGSLSAIASSSPASSPSAVSPSSPSVSTTRISLPELRSALADGTLDRRILAVDTGVRSIGPLCTVGIRAGCSNPARLDVLGNVQTEMQPGFPAVPVWPGQKPTAAVGRWLVVPFHGQLLLLGRANPPELASPPTVETLDSLPIASDDGPALQPIAGWLLTGMVTPCASGVACAPMTEISSSSTPLGGPAFGVTVASPALGVDASSRVSAGPFLVRSGVVVARYDPSAVIAVDLPPVRCNLARETGLPSCSDIADEAIAAMSPIGPVTSIEVDQGAYCAPGWACPTVEPDRVHVRVNSPTGDWLVELAYGRDGSLASVQTRQLSPGGPGSPSP
ncbi:MAG: hypothetical protein ACYDAN_11770 [Candidatus Limnocylindrales bacterium]